MCKYNFNDITLLSRMDRRRGSPLYSTKTAGRPIYFSDIEVANVTLSKKDSVTTNVNDQTGGVEPIHKTIHDDTTTIADLLQPKDMESSTAPN